MIGQHIYSRCTEGYFSRSGSKGDSTTVTISRDMFAREDQAKLTYSSSYILAEEDKGRFLREPEYALNLQNFEPYPSVQARIDESKRNGARGRIEANPEYSLFKNPQKKTEISVFERAGFTQELFIDYISSIVQRVGYMDYRGHENDKVLVVLPDQFRPAWNADHCGNFESSAGFHQSEYQCSILRRSKSGGFCPEGVSADIYGKWICKRMGKQ